ncbi:MAG: hypothetical protein HY093_01990 [Candidatus Liptonbacteria bacterium]|nr:hypothetical protein [Candidatus Liptonbacteria bacterium]
MGSVNITSEQKALIVGTLLGDGSIEKRWKNPRLRIDHAAHQKDYVFWKYAILKNIATREPHIIHDRDNRNGKVFTRWYFSTKAIPQLEVYYRLFYQNNRKTISSELSNHFTEPLSLAVWLMDDGYKRSDCDALRLSTDCFTYKEQLVLRNCLDKNFGVRSVIHSKGNTWNIYIPSTQMIRVRSILTPHIIPSMNYKLPPRNDLVTAQL